LSRIPTSQILLFERFSSFVNFYFLGRKKKTNPKKKIPNSLKLKQHKQQQSTTTSPTTSPQQHQVNKQEDIKNDY